EPSWEARVGSRRLRCAPGPDGDAELRVGERVIRAERISLLRWRGAAAADLDRDERPEAVVAAWEGRRCTLWWIEAAGAPVELPGRHSERARFEDRDGDGRVELVTREECLRGWRGASEADTLSVELILERGEAGWYRRPGTRPSDEELSERATALRGQGERALLAALLELHAQGHADALPGFLATAWPERSDARARFAHELAAHLQASPYENAPRIAASR
ncbi:MAG TPA: hypothetical protein DEA08_39005, partial [Planctomycetes bacterium]|nr:hypothetical protein [Planctomycetota bacterium]